MLYAEDPGAQQDAEAARAKLLKAADQIDMIETHSETTKTALDGMKADISKLQEENATLKQQLAELQATFEKAEAAHAKEQKVLLDTVAGMVASGKNSSTSKPPAKKKEVSTPPKAPDGEASTGTTDTGNPAGTTTTTDSAAVSDTSAPKTQKGYYHIVESGETLTLICSAYRQQGVNVTIVEIQKANGLTDKSVLKVGQKLFIPKPGT